MMASGLREASLFPGYLAPSARFPVERGTCARAWGRGDRKSGISLIPRGEI